MSLSFRSSCAFPFKVYSVVGRQAELGTTLVSSVNMFFPHREQKIQLTF